MALITLPSKVLWDEVGKLQLLRAGVTLRSRYTGKRQSVRFPFALWVFEGKLIPMEGLDAAEWRSFLLELEGDQNTFKLPVPGVFGPVSGYSGNLPITTGTAPARAKSISVTGVTPNAVLFRRGDYFNVGDELKMAKGLVTADGSGNAVIAFEPGLRQAAGPGIALRIYDPFIVLAAADNDSGSWALEKPIRHKISIKAIEAF